MIPIRRFGLILALVWTMAAAASLWWNLDQEKRETLRIARNVALTNYERDILYRRWASAHGGVYVPVDAQTPPSPYMAHLAERDLKTPSGRVLTLLNPAYMTRQVYELAKQRGLPQGHLTSLQPLRPENAPDSWEKEALLDFMRGNTEVAGVVKWEGQDYFRLMRPFITEQSCLNCHAEQGYKVGDIRGGISVMVPMAPLLNKPLHSRLALGLGHFALWLLGIAGIIGAVRQVGKSTEEKIRAQKAAAAAATAIQTIDGMMDSVIITDLEGRITQYNKALAEFFGWGEEILGEFPAKFTAPKDGPKILQAIQECLQKGYEKDIECVLLTKDHKEVPVLINANLMKDPDGHPTGTIEVIRDITARNEAEKQLKDSENKLRLLASQILTAQESERRRLSKDLHDDLGQSLLVMKLQLRGIEKELHDDQEIVKRNCEHTIKYIEETIDNVRRLSRDLSPSILEDFGLYSALNHLLEEFGRYNGVKISLEMDQIDAPLGQESQIIIYRIIQEILTNIGKHSGATQVSLTIKRQGENISFQIEDNGKGFSVETLSTLAAKDRGLGLATMNERVRMLGGELKILSHQGQGTWISFTVPLG